MSTVLSSFTNYERSKLESIRGAPSPFCASPASSTYTSEYHSASRKPPGTRPGTNLSNALETDNKRRDGLFYFFTALPFPYPYTS